MKIIKVAAIVVAAVTLAVVTAGVASGFSAAMTFSYLAAGTIGTLGISATAATAILGGIVALGAVSALAAIAPQPSGGGSQTKWKADPYAGVPYVMGRTGTSGNIIGKRGSGGKNTYEHFVTVLSVCTINALEASFANKTTLAFPGGNGTPPSGFYSTRIYQRWQKGLCPEPVALQPIVGVFPDWNNATAKLSGLAAVLNTMEYDGKGKNTLTTEPQMFWILQGVFVYDPRLDSTYPGGSGACRAFDESTYVYSENPHLHGLTWAMGRYQNGKRVCGIGAKIEEIDVASFVEGANLDDARNWKIGGQVVTRPDAPWSSLKAILQAGGAQPALVGGIIVCLNRYPRVSLATITGADIVGDCTFAGTQPRRSRINGIIPMYRSEAHDWETVTAAGIIVADYVAIDGDERTKEVQYSLVQDVDQATQLAAYDVCDAREAGPGTVPLGPWWLNYRIGDCVTFNPEDGFLIKALITGRDLDAQTGTVTYTLVSETDGKHAFALGQTGVAPPTATIIYDTYVYAPLATAWSANGTTLSSSGGSVPAIEVDGAVDVTAVSDVVFDLRLHVAGQADDAGWETVSTDPADITRKLIGTVSPGTVYDVGIRYIIRGVTGDRLILGPVTAGVLSISQPSKPAAPSVSAQDGVGSNAVTVRAPQSTPFDHIDLLGGATNNPTAMTVIEAGIVIGLGATFSGTYSASPGTRYYSAIAYAADGTPSDPAMPASAVIS